MEACPPGRFGWKYRNSPAICRFHNFRGSVHHPHYRFGGKSGNPSLTESRENSDGVWNQQIEHRTDPCRAAPVRLLVDRPRVACARDPTAPDADRHGVAGTGICNSRVDLARRTGRGLRRRGRIQRCGRRHQDSATGAVRQRVGPAALRARDRNCRRDAARELGASAAQRNDRRRTAVSGHAAHQWLGV